MSDQALDLFSVDDSDYGADSITRDLFTSLDWLDVPFSQGRSFLDVSDEFGAGGDFEGFRHATVADFTGLVDSAGIPGLGIAVTEDLTPFTNLIDLVGATSDGVGGNASTLGFLNNSDVPSLRRNGDLSAFGTGNGTGYQATTGTSRSESLEFETVGHWLVREAPEVLNSLYFSASPFAFLEGVNVSNEDVVRFDGNEFTQFFDGSDVGLSGAEIDAFDVVSDATILLSFATPITLPGLGEIDDSDIVQFSITTAGETTAGEFSMYFDGSDVGLTRFGEDIDALTVAPNGDLIVSTLGSVRTQDVIGRDEDLLRFSPEGLGSDTQGTWSLYADGSDIGLSAFSENINGVGLHENGDLLLSTAGNFNTLGISGANEDAFIFRPTTLGLDTSGRFKPNLFFDGSEYGLDFNSVTAVDFV